MILTVQVEELDAHRGAQRLVDDDSVAAICVEGVYTAAVCAEVSARLERAPWSAWRSAREHTRPGCPQVEVVGHPVSPSMLFPDGPAVEPYFGAAGDFAARCGELFGVDNAFADRVRRVLGALFDADVVVGPTVDARTYGTATLRRVPVGCGMGLHCENLYTHIAVLAPLRPLADLGRTVSVFVVLQAPEAGGELRVFGESPPDAHPTAAPSGVVRPPAGTMVVFAGGRRWHDVSPVFGEHPRWSIGGFAAPARRGRRIYFWA